MAAETNGGAPLVLSLSVSSDQNARYRRSMEDQHVSRVDEEGFKRQGFFAVIDGHGGRQAADEVEAALFETFREHLRRRQGDKLIAEIFNETFLEVDETLKRKGVLSPGCTIVVAYIDYSRDDGTVTLYTANLGDARAVLSRNGRATRLSFDHKASDPNEQHRIMTAGGFIMRERVNGTLAITRALGDIPLKPYVVANPYTTEVQLSPNDDLLILACDGVWDVITDQGAIEFASTFDSPQEASDQLLKEAIKLGSMDNITVMVIKLTWAAGATGPTAHSVTPNLLPEEQQAAQSA